MTITGNHFTKQGCAITINPTSIVQERTKAYHTNIRIENNIFNESPEEALVEKYEALMAAIAKANLAL